MSRKIFYLTKKNKTKFTKFLISNFFQDSHSALMCHFIVLKPVKIDSIAINTHNFLLLIFQLRVKLSLIIHFFCLNPILVVNLSFPQASVYLLIQILLVQNF